MQQLHRALIEGQADVPRVGRVIRAETSYPRYVVLDAAGALLEPVVQYLRDVALSDNRPLTGRSYAFDLLRWFRVLWFLDVPWQKATEAETSVLGPVAKVDLGSSP